MQKHALQAYPGLAPYEHDHLWPDYLGCLLRLLRPDQLQAAASEDDQEGGLQPSARDLKRWANSSLLMETVLTVLVDLFRWPLRFHVLHYHTLQVLLKKAIRILLWL